MRANNQERPRLAEACRPKIIQGQDGTSQNCNTMKGFALRDDAQHCERATRSKSIAAKTPRSGDIALNANLHMRHAGKCGASKMLQI